LDDLLFVGVRAPIILASHSQSHHLPIISHGQFSAATLHHGTSASSSSLPPHTNSVWSSASSSFIIITLSLKFHHPSSGINHPSHHFSLSGHHFAKWPSSKNSCHFLLSHSLLRSFNTHSSIQHASSHTGLSTANSLQQLQSAWHHLNISLITLASVSTHLHPSAWSTSLPHQPPLSSSSSTFNLISSLHRFNQSHHSCHQVLKQFSSIPLPQMSDL